MALGAAALLPKPVRVELPLRRDVDEDRPHVHLTPAQLVERIIDLNPTAEPAFLARFQPKALADYLDHLALTREPRGKSSTWVRRRGEPAICARAAAI